MAQTVTVSATDDSTVEDDALASVSHRVSGADYGSVPVDPVAVTVPGFETTGDTVMLRIPMTGDMTVTVPEGTPVPAGLRVTFPSALGGEAVEISAADAPEETPQGFRAGDAVVNIELAGGMTLSGEATVCLPGRGRVYRYDEEATPPEWVMLEEPAGGSPTGLSCGVTKHFSLFALGSAPHTAVAKAWLARFGRTAAEHVLDAVQQRFEAGREAGFEVSLAGQRIGAANGGLHDGPEALSMRLGDRFDDLWSEPHWQTRRLTARDLVTESRFSLASEARDGGSIAMWGQGAQSSFDGREGATGMDGDVTTATVGGDWASGSLTAGLALSHSDGEGSWRLDGEENGMEATLTGLYPYLGYRLTDRFSMWGAAGYGWGEFEMSEDRRRLKTGIGMTMLATGARGELIPRSAETGLALALKADGLVLRIRADRTEGLEAVEADVSRLRIGPEGSVAMEMGGGRTLTPSMEVGLRHDGGDAETGFGADVGFGLEWSDPERGLRAEVRARGLLAHEDSRFRVRGISGSLAWDASPETARGFSLALSQTAGSQASGGMEALLARATTSSLATDDEEDELHRRRFEARMGYGFSLPGDRFIGTPEVGLVLSDAGREYHLGWRMGLGPEASGAFALGLVGRHREGANDNEDPEDRIDLNLTIRW